jgi:hypothetical protein
MTRDAAPTGRRAHRPDCGDAALRTRRVMKLLSGLAPCRAAGVVESLPRLTVPEGSVSGFGTLSRRRTSLKVDIPGRGPDGPRHRVAGTGPAKATGPGGPAPLLPDRPDQIPPEQETASPNADGAFDTRACHDAIAAPGAAAFGHALERTHRRSRAETTMHCATLPGQRLSARDFGRQVAEVPVRVAVLDGSTALAIPATEAAG